MSRLVLLLILGIFFTPPLRAGTILQVQGRGFLLSVSQPEGWKTDFGSARQIANFVMFPGARSWRDAEVAVFARILPRQAEDDLESFMKEDQERFSVECPFYETNPVGIRGEGRRSFLTRYFYCPGRRYEVLAVAQVPGFFAAFVLTSDQKTQVEEALPSLEEILDSFRWEKREPDPRQESP